MTALLALSDAELHAECIAEATEMRHHHRCGQQSQCYLSACRQMDRVLEEISRRRALLPA